MSQPISSFMKRQVWTVGRVLQSLVSPNLDQASGIKIVRRALEEPLRCIVSNAAEEPAIVLHKVEELCSAALATTSRRANTATC